MRPVDEFELDCIQAYVGFDRRNDSLVRRISQMDYNTRTRLGHLHRFAVKDLWIDVPHMILISAKGE
jgi:hypothetical protein